MKPTSRGDRALLDLWPDLKPVVGMIHLLPLPGSPRWEGSMGCVLDRAVTDAGTLVDGGVDGLLVENFGDAPFLPTPVRAETVAAMAVVVREIGRSFPVPMGVNVLRNDAYAAMATAAAADAAFIRVNVHIGSMFTDQGLIQGRAHDTLRLRRSLGASVAVLADVFVKHATPPPGATLMGVARDTLKRGLADALILTGAETGLPVEAGEVQRLRKSLPEDASVWVGSGVRPETAETLLEVADGLIVGSTLQRDGRAGGGVEASRVRALFQALGRR